MKSLKKALCEEGSTVYKREKENHKLKEKIMYCERKEEKAFKAE